MRLPFVLALIKAQNAREKLKQALRCTSLLKRKYRRF